MTDKTEQIELKITGSGSKEQLLTTLQIITRAISRATEEELQKGIEYENPYLFGDIKTIE